MEGALQLAAGIELERAGRFLTVMDTLVTLAPLLGLLGTVTGLMRAFLGVGTAELAVSAVTGGIGEALIATACGLVIAIFALIPFNYFNGRVARLQFELETAATNVEVMVNEGKLDARRNREASVTNRSLKWKIRFLASSSQAYADRDHSAHRHHVLSARRVHDGQPANGPHPKHRGQPAVRHAGRSTFLISSRTC